MLYVITTNNYSKEISVLDSSTGVVTNYPEAELQKKVEKGELIRGAYFKDKYSYKECETLRKALKKDPKLLEEKLNEKVFNIEKIWKIAEDDKHVLILSEERIFDDSDSDDFISGCNFGATHVYLFVKEEDKLTKFVRVVKLNNYQGEDSVDFEYTDVDLDNNYTKIEIESLEIDIECGGHYNNRYRINISLYNGGLTVETNSEYNDSEVSLSSEELEQKIEEIGKNVSDY